jgi:hypothetical protein
MNGAGRGGGRRFARFNKSKGGGGFDDAIPSRKGYAGRGRGRGRLGRGHGHGHGHGHSLRDSSEPQDYAAQQATLAELGFKYPRRNLRLLTKFNGDVDQVVATIAAREEKRMARRAEKLENQAAAAPDDAPPAVDDAVVAVEPFAAEERELRELGFGCRGPRNARLLTKFGGDVSQVVATLRERQERSALRRAERVAARQQLAVDGNCTA